jgi:hypothetical protein
MVLSMEVPPSLDTRSLARSMGTLIPLLSPEQLSPKLPTLFHSTTDSIPSLVLPTDRPTLYLLLLSTSLALVLSQLHSLVLLA